MKKGERGFTLLELIIAISIGTTLILLVSFSVRMGFLQMEKGSKWLDESHRRKSALQFFYQQVSSMRNENSNGEVVFSGDSDKIFFVTPISLEKRYSLGLMAVLYYREKDENGYNLNYQEKRFLPDESTDKFEDVDNTMFNGSEKVTIFDGCEEIAFKFLDEQESENESSGLGNVSLEWKDSWLKNSLPKAIKVVMSKSSQNREMIAPIMVMY
ncbi:MAG: type II secretion system protein J [Candidatus Scalinduaceae bacterium]